MLLPPVFAFKAVRRLAFRTVSQTAISYRGRALSEGRAGGVHGGARLPWVPIEASIEKTDNFAPLASLDCQVHVYGDVEPSIRALCADRHLTLH